MKRNDLNSDSASPARYWTETFGDALCGMSCVLGIPLEETALCVAGVLTNVTGPLSGIGRKQGKGIASGINVIALGGSSHRTQRLSEHLFHPVYALQDFMRHSAQRTSRTWGDLYHFGPAGLKSWFESLQIRPPEVHGRMVELLEVTVKDLKAGDGLPIGWDSAMDPMPDGMGKHPELVLRERVPGFRQQPSFVLRPGGLGELQEMMADVADQYVFITDLDGRLFDDQSVEGGAKRAAWMRHLAELMGGKDVPMPRLHPDQGHGTLVRSRAALFSSLALARVAEFLSEERCSAERVIIEEAVLWKPTWHKVRQLPDGWNSRITQHYKKILESLVNDRANRNGTIVQHTPILAKELESLETEVVHMLDAIEPSLAPYLRPFSAFVSKLAWAFSLLGIADTALPNAVRATVAHALTNHVSSLKSALSQVETQRAAKFARQIEAVLKAKGPCTARDVQRSIYQSRIADIDVGLGQLVGTGRVIYVQAKRQYLIPSSTEVGRPRAAVSSTLNAEIHG